MPRPVLRSKSFFLPPVHNPFKIEFQLPWYRKVQMAVATVTLVPIRLILMLIFTFLAWVTTLIILIGTTREGLATKPMSGWRKKGRAIVHFWSLANFAAFGFVWRRIGSPAPKTEISAVTVAPHSSFCDVIVSLLLGDDIPYAVSRAENFNIPVIGQLIKLTQPISVSREDKNSRHKTIDEIKARANSDELWPPFLIFPEGTCTNRQALISFKPGGFIPGKPVQPVVLRYPDSWDSVTWTWDGPGLGMVVWMSLCKLWTIMEVEFLPVYNPNEEESNNPHLYADNVRAVMAEALQVPVTDHTYEDCRLMEYARKANLKIGDALVEFRKMQKKLGMSYEQIKELLDKFSELSSLNDNEGKVDLQTFSRYMGLPVNESLQELFSLYDRDGSGNIDFREYVIGMSLISEPANADETIRLAFKLFDRDSKGYVTRQEFNELLLDTLNTNSSDANALFDKVDSTTSGHVTFDDFKAYAHNKPEYAALFTTYHRLNGTPSSSDSALLVESNKLDGFSESSPSLSQEHKLASPGGCIEEQTTTATNVDV